MRPRTSLTLLLSVLLLGAVCAGPDPNLTESAKGKPGVRVSFPEQVTPAAVETATIEVANPGPGDIESLFVTFSLVGIGGSDGVAEPLVDIGARARSPSVVAVRPKPDATSSDGVTYKFSDPDGSGPVLEAGRSFEVQFDVRVPAEPGRAASSVQVYAGEDPERSQGALLETEVAGL
jgi:hypothetical protein